MHLEWIEVQVLTTARACRFEADIGLNSGWDCCKRIRSGIRKGIWAMRIWVER